MMCLLCLDENKKFINIFHEEGVKRNIKQIIAKHFWFEAREDDPARSSICISCWIKLEAFHTFYLAVEFAHSTFAESPIEKLELGSGDNDDTSIVPNELDEMMANHAEQEFVETNSISFEALPTLEDPIKCESVSNEEEPELGRTRSRTKAFQEKETRAENEKQNESTADCESDEENSTFEMEESTTDDDEEQIKPKNRKSVEVGAKSNLKRGRPRIHPHHKEEKAFPRRKKNQELDELIARYFPLLQCDMCSTELENFKELKVHFEKAHNTKKAYAVCCDRKFIKRNILAEHITGHINPEFFKCEECGKVLKTKQSLKAHIMVNHRADEFKIHHCDVCPQKFTHLSALNTHKLMHLPDEERSHVCEKCGKSFCTKFKLKYHNEQVHERRYERICDICGKTFTRPEQLKTHKLTHDGLQLKVSCEICGKELSSKHGLNRHMQEIHTENYFAICDICGKVATNPRALKRHVYYMHTMERRHKCTVCPMAFKKEFQLREHLCTHTGGALYTCPYCPRTFGNASSMHKHRKKDHPIEFEENRRHFRSCIGNPGGASMTNEEATEAEYTV